MATQYLLGSWVFALSLYINYLLYKFILKLLPEWKDSQGHQLPSYRFPSHTEGEGLGTVHQVGWELGENRPQTIAG